LMVQTAVRAAVLGHDGAPPRSPSRVLAACNRAIRANLGRIGSGQYMTICALLLEDDVIRYAGLHQDILVYRAATAALERVETNGIWLGLLDEIEPLLSDATVRLYQGDVMLLFTDGIVDEKTAGRRLGVDELGRLFFDVASACDTSRAVVDGLFARLGDLSFADDATLVAIRRSAEAPEVLS
jgi:serine phosphatase RsbU (regulator of sigma subunit)